MLQKRSAFAHEGGTWSCAGGALDLGETPIEGALREASEEVGAIPGTARVVGEYEFVPATDWTYTTVVVEVDEPFGESINFETDAVGWFTFDEVDELPLHAGFAAAWPHLRAIIAGSTITRTVNGTCHHDCPDSCGWTVTVEGDGAGRRCGEAARQRRPPVLGRRAVPEGQPVPRSRLQPRPDAHPLRRVGPKGSGEFEPITWDDALTEIADRLHGVIDTHGPEAVLPFSDAGNQSLLSMMGLSGRFFGHMGASRIDRNICGPTVGAGMRMTNGTRPRHGRARTRTFQADPAVGHQHQAHQPPSLADHREGPLQRGAHRGDRPDPHRSPPRPSTPTAATSSSSPSPAPTSR